MKLYNRYLRVTIYPDLNPIFIQVQEELGRELTEDEKYVIQSYYPPVVINQNPDDFKMTCAIVRTVSKATQLLLDITNLSAFIRLHLLNAKYKRISIEAGYLGADWSEGSVLRDSDLDILFKGSLIWMGTKIEARKNVVTRFVGISGNAEALASYPGLMALNYQAGYNLYQLIREVHLNSYNPDIRLNIPEEEKELLLETTTGAVKPTDLGQILDNFSIDMTYDWSGTSAFDTDDYINFNSPDNDGKIYPVNSETGLINIPSLQGERKLKFTMLLNSKIKLFDYVRLNNYDINLPLLDDWTQLEKANSGYYLDREGIYRISRITYGLNSRGTSFTMEVEAIARDIYEQVVGEY